MLKGVQCLDQYFTTAYVMYFINWYIAYYFYTEQKCLTLLSFYLDHPKSFSWSHICFADLPKPECPVLFPDEKKAATVGNVSRYRHKVHVKYPNRRGVCCVTEASCFKKWGECHSNYNKMIYLHTLLQLVDFMVQLFLFHRHTQLLD